MDLNELRRLLMRIARIVEQSGGGKRADALRAFAQVVTEEGAYSVDDAIGCIRARLASRTTSKKKAVRSKVPSPSVDQYVQLLQALSAASDLENMLQTFRSKGFKKATLEQIAHRFAKGPAKYKTKEDAIRDIEQRVSQRRRAANELDYLERKKVTPW